MIGPEHLQILQPLGADQATFVARETSTGEARLAVVERVTRASPVPAARAELLRRGRALRALEHPKVVRVHDVFERDGEVVVVSDFVDGEWLSSLMMMSPRPPLSVLLRLVIDILEGLGALHGLKDERDQPLGFVHGAIGPDTVLVADDGVAEIARACRLPRPGMNERYVAPELRRGGDGPPDVRADVYAAGAILRDVLADAGGSESWAEPLTDIAWRACSVDEDNRWPSAAAMATAIRRIAGPKLATAAVAAEFMRRRFGEKMDARRKGFEALRDSVPPSSEPLSLKPSEMELLEPSEPTLANSRTPPLPLVHPEPPPPPAKKPRLTLEGATEPVEHEPETKRRPPTTTPPGLGPVKPPSAAPRAPTPAPPKAAAPHVSLPPPTIRPIDEAAAVDQYRRQMPTFPTFEEEPPRRRVAVRGIITAGAMGLTFVLGWWVGRTFAPAPEVRQAACASATAQIVATSTPQPTSEPAAVPAPVALSSASAEASADVPPPTASVVASVASAPGTAPAPVTTTPVPAHPVATGQAPVVVAPRPTAIVAPPSTAPAPKPTSKPGGYVPEEL